MVVSTVVGLVTTWAQLAVEDPYFSIWFLYNVAIGRRFVAHTRPILRRLPLGQDVSRMTSIGWKTHSIVTIARAPSRQMNYSP